MKTSIRRIIAVHLYNDYSGSPRVLAEWLKHATRTGRKVELHTSTGPGVLDEVVPAVHKNFNYAPRRNKWLGLLHFLRIQWKLFHRIRRSKREGAVVYVNTLLPFGAILGARLARIPVLCHVHEVSVRPRPLYRFLRWVARRGAGRLVFVSDFVKQASGLEDGKEVVVPNALSTEFLEEVDSKKKKEGSRFRILMLASVRAYKGLHQFVDLAERIPQCDFELVLNGSQSEISTFFSGRSLPQNLICWPAQKNVHPFYGRADLVLNLSLPDAWVETFGLTALEGMAYGIPVIVPPVGGIAELVEDGVSGFHCDAYDGERLASLVRRLVRDRRLYEEMGRAALLRSLNYRFEAFARSMDREIEELAVRPKLGRQTQVGMQAAMQAASATPQEG